MKNGFVHFNAINQQEGDTEAIYVYIEGPDEKVERFIDFVHTSLPTHAQVSTIRVEPYEGDVLPLSTYLQYLQFEQLNKGIPAILNIESMQREVLTKQDQTLTILHESVKKQDQMLAILNESSNKQDQMISCQKETTEEIHGFRKDLTEMMSERFTRLEQELATIKDALHKAGIMA